MDAQIAVIVGPLVSLLFQLLKKWKWLDATDATVKQTSVAVLAGLGVLAAQGWQVNRETLFSATLAAVAALATHKGLLAAPKAVTTDGATQ